VDILFLHLISKNSLWSRRHVRDLDGTSAFNPFTLPWAVCLGAAGPAKTAKVERAVLVAFLALRHFPRTRLNYSSSNLLQNHTNSPLSLAHVSIGI